MRTAFIWIVAALATLCLAKAPKSKPATLPSSQPASADARSKVDELMDKRATIAAMLKAEREAALDRLRATEVYQTAKAELERNTRAHDEALTHGTPQQKLDAGSAFNKSRLKVHAMEAAAVNTPTILALQDREAELNQQIAQAQQEQQDQEKAEAKRKADERRDRAAPAVTAQQLDANGGSLVELRVKVEDCRLVEIDPSIVLEIPNVRTSEEIEETAKRDAERMKEFEEGFHGRQFDWRNIAIDSRNAATPPNPTQVPPARHGLGCADDWIGFVVQIPRQSGAILIVGPKAVASNTVASVGPHARMTIYGTVIKLQQDNRYAIDCDKIIVAAERQR